MTSTPSAPGSAAGSSAGSSVGSEPSADHSPPPAYAPPGPRVNADQVRDLTRLRRTVTDRKVAGVAAGIARHLDIDPVIVRVAFVVLSLFGGAGVVVYAACWILLPQDGQQHQPLGLDERSRSVALILVGVLGVALLVGQWDWFWLPGPLILIALVVWLVMSRRNQPAAVDGPGGPVPPVPSGVPGAGPDAVTPEQRWAAASTAPTAPTAPMYPTAPTAPPTTTYPTTYLPPVPRNPRKRGPKLFWFTLALSALAVGVVSIVDVSGASVAPSTYFAVVVAVVGVMLLVGSFYGRAGGLIFLGLMAAAGTGIGLASENFDGDNVTVAPLTAAQVEARYDYDTGQYTLDLTRVRDLQGLDGRTIHLTSNVGELHVLVPDALDVTVHGIVNGPGALSIFGNDTGGIDTERTYSHDGGTGVPELSLEMELDVGQIYVETR